MSQAQRAWRFQLDSAFSMADHRLQGVEFTSHWFVIRDGMLFIREGYAWDGCSPAYYLPLVGWISPPNGGAGKDGFPKAYYPSLVHDAFCQFRAFIAVDNETVVQIFHDMLLAAGFPKWAAKLYAWMVTHFGPREWMGRNGYTFDLPERYASDGAWARG